MDANAALTELRDVLGAVPNVTAELDDGTLRVHLDDPVEDRPALSLDPTSQEGRVHTRGLTGEGREFPFRITPEGFMVNRNAFPTAAEAADRLLEYLRGDRTPKGFREADADY